MKFFKPISILHISIYYTFIHAHTHVNILSLKCYKNVMETTTKKCLWNYTLYYVFILISHNHSNSWHDLKRKWNSNPLSKKVNFDPHHRFALPEWGEKRAEMLKTIYHKLSRPLPILKIEWSIKRLLSIKMQRTSIIRFFYCYY